MKMKMANLESEGAPGRQGIAYTQFPCTNW
jgi:hypothetical protein